MRVSQKFHLDADQAELDFVDIDVVKDTPLFLDSYLLALNQDPWSLEASNTQRSFFSFFLGLLYSGDKDGARDLFDHLHEPNETCLGLSRKRPQGRGVGDDDAQRIFDSLAESQAAKTGLLHDLEDCRVFVKGIGKDKASDMTTNIIRRHLIEYTMQQCRLWDIPLTARSPSGFCWNAENRTWETGFSENLHIGGKRILLVPKSAVSYCKQYAPDKYHRHFLLKFLQNEHLRLGTSLVQTRVRRDRTEVRFVTKKSLIERGGAAFDKDFLATFTQAHPEVFADFRAAERTRENSIPIEDLVSQDIDSICSHLESKLTEVPTGPDFATRYHRVVVSILDFILYPHLSKPSVEQRIHDGRKRIDVTFDNGATRGFFSALSNQAQIPCRYVFAECKNYGSDVGNPEVDQLSGRFSFNTGRFGLLLCRSVEDMDLLLRRCRDTLHDGRGLVIPLVDDDLIHGLRQRATREEYPLQDRLERAHRRIALEGI
jgi:hypothetical protein